jgi:hypothetical protein
MALVGLEHGVELEVEVEVADMGAETGDWDGGGRYVLGSLYVCMHVLTASGA